jgi:hypothetical protein
MSDRSELAIVCLVLVAGALVLGAPLLGRAGAARAADGMMVVAAAAGLAAFLVAAWETVHAVRRQRTRDGGAR